MHKAYGFPLRLAGCFSLVAIVTIYDISIGRGELLVLSTGVTLAYLLLAPRRSWPAYLGASFLAHVVAIPLLNNPWAEQVFFFQRDLIGALAMALLLRRRSAQLPNFTSLSYLLRFVTYAFLLPFSLSLINAPFGNWWFHIPITQLPGQTSVAQGFGILVATPACVAVFRANLRRSFFAPKNWMLVIPVVAFTFLIFRQTAIPASFMVFPLLLLVLVRLGLGWASLTTLFITAVCGWLTADGFGPFASANRISHLPSGILLQLFIAAAMVMLYGISILLEDLRIAERRLQRIAALHHLVMENSRDLIIVSDFAGRRSFVSAAASSWGNWSREEILNHHGVGLVHPEDGPHVLETIRELRSGKEGALIEYRARCKDGAYNWVEASLRTIRDPVSRMPTGILSNIREITERKCAEQKLEDAYHVAETLAVTDPLTGLPNRRRFDQCLTDEWRRALREQLPLSLLLVDADLFKVFNDTYGHPSGDLCLNRIAEVMRAAAARSGDLAARIGGEEFILLLPNTTPDGARLVAERLCQAMRDQSIPHSGNPGGLVTVSIGCSTLVPRAGQNFKELFGLADQALYAAKAAGRNCVVSRTPPVEDETSRGSIPSVHVPV